MMQTLLQEKYLVYALELPKAETTHRDCDEVMAFLKARVDDHKVAVYIAEFDHYVHTSALEEDEPQGR